MVICKNCGKITWSGTACPDCDRSRERSQNSLVAQPLDLSQLKKQRAKVVDGKCSKCGAANKSTNVVCLSCFSFFDLGSSTPASKPVILDTSASAGGKAVDPPLFKRAKLVNGKCSNCGKANEKINIICSHCYALFQAGSSAVVGKPGVPDAGASARGKAVDPAPLFKPAKLVNGKCSNCGGANTKTRIFCSHCSAFFGAASSAASKPAAKPRVDAPAAAGAKRPSRSPPESIAFTRFSNSIRRKCGVCDTVNGEFDFICRQCGAVLPFKITGLDQPAPSPVRLKQTAAKPPAVPATRIAYALKVFLCHCSEDKPRVKKLYRQLKGGGMAPWLDEEDLLPGQDWDLAIRRALRESDAVLVCLSARSVSKAGYIQREISHVLDLASHQPEGSIFLIPTRLENCSVPDRLSKYQWVDLFTDAGYERLMRALATVTPRSP